MQPTFLPWLGYFALMDSVDLFVYLDDVQISPKSYMTRNRVPQGRSSHTWLTIEESKELSLPERILKDTKIVNAESAYNEISGTLISRYDRDRLTRFLPFLNKTFLNSNSMAELNISLIEFLCVEFGITPKVVRASTLNSTGEKSRKVLSVLNNFDWSTYVVVPGSVAYMKLDEVWLEFEQKLKVFNYIPVSYEQRNVDEFIPYMSAIDALFELGSNNALIKMREGVLELKDWH